MRSERRQTQKDYILCDSSSMKYPEKANLWRQQIYGSKGRSGD